MKNTAKFQLSHSKTLTSTPTPIVNIAGGGEYPLSAFNQFKHFLALSLLITFSFNAFSVDNSQQPNKEEFNKEAYLDLSKPYKQKNPQSATKKDNQATILLKEVADSARTALGSTNSGNTDQLGNKVTTSIKNQAINKTEGLVNDKANTFLNTFGAGRSEVSIGGISAKKLTYSLRTIQPLSELNANSKQLTFIQAGIASGNGNNSRRTTINLGVGHRLLVEDDMAIAGINFFTDYESKSRHKRLSLGLEYQRANFSANINRYHAFSDKKLVNGLQKPERAMSGYDVKLSGQAPYLPWAKIKGTYYYWDAKLGPDIKGNILGVDIELTPSVSFEFGQENNNAMDAKSYGKLTVKLPLGNKQKFTNFSIASKAFKDSHKMDLGALAWVERSNKIMIERNGKVGNTISFKGLTYALIVSPYTKRVWLDRNIGATAVATADEAAVAEAATVSQKMPSYGDYVEFSSNDSICPAGFSVPTEGEFAAETTRFPQRGTNVATVLLSFLKLPAAGVSSDNITPIDSVNSLSVWTKSTDDTDDKEGRYFFVKGNDMHYLSTSKTHRQSVRCIKERTKILFKGQTYGLVTSPFTNRVWLDRNLGATQVATAKNDHAAYGHYYQWGRNDDGHEDRTKTGTSSTLATDITDAGTNLFITSTNSTNDWASVDVNGALRMAAWKDGGANDICPAGFSVPTEAVLGDEIAKSGISGSNGAATRAFTSFLKIPTSGFRHNTGGAVNLNRTFSHFWVRSATTGKSRVMDINPNNARFIDSNRASGFSVRCVLE
ncbi:inverse autotransporter beta domain-containing protein [bacterium endosymbiont of Bathymodiolus sp. 5 South]|uniref:inverse autotransporter beta domain-containing protein n=1 Tax=bacterium endosymbiont of Bathymodiolus sp. 5 South TaxID=1181670 RepID=UPI0010BC94F9|nr:inverse autotransporter beta domain-containing protein [bacterium endosymbiont of Bathymodiolus sp. 5 South]SSC07294.1 hypothetical protein BTURTLESOX_1872 [bacterium endosymbiont of Bathymodiolus sp. 5 South]VVH61089.1 hypothetical protein BSPWISOX_2185 [uncultured Gammaproteobacteria bacterium]